MISGGHAQNALPQRASANVNCRIFPGHKPADIVAELARVIGDPDGGIPPGTAFEDIPADWFCPVCGARTSDFRPLEPGEA